MGQNAFLGKHYPLEVTVLSQGSRHACEFNSGPGKPFFPVLGDPSSLSRAFLQNSVLLFCAARTTESKEIGKDTSFSSQFSLFSPSLPLRHWHVMFPALLLPFLVFFLLFSLGAFSSSEQTLQCTAICIAARSGALSHSSKLRQHFHSLKTLQ